MNKVLFIENDGVCRSNLGVVISKFIDDADLRVLSNDTDTLLKSLQTERYDKVFIDSELSLDSSVWEMINRQNINVITLSGLSKNEATVDSCFENESKKRESQQVSSVYYAKLVCMIKHGVVFVDCCNKIVYMNDFFCTMAGIEKDEFVYKNVFDLFVEDEKSSLPVGLQCGEFRKAEVFLVNEFQNIRIPVSIDYQQLENEEAVLVVTDMRRRRETERVILDQNKKLTRLDKLKEDFIDNVSHELRTPLTISKEAVCLLSDKVLGVMNESQRHFLDVALKNLQRLTNIINRLLEMSRVKSDDLIINKKETTLDSLTEKVYNLYRVQAAHKGVVFSCECDKSSPFMIDSDKAIRILSLIVENALKFSSLEDKISISGSCSETEAVILIKDTGCGIPIEELDNIFDSFHQVNRTFGPGEKGTGLGLSIANGLVEMLDGSIDIDSSEGEGSSFKITFPLNYDKILNGGYVI